MSKRFTRCAMVAMLLTAPLLVPGTSTTLAGSSLMVGSEAPAFTLPDFSGEEYSLETAAQGSQGVVIIWVSTRCPVSNDYNERMVELAGRYQAEGFRFLGINSNKAESTSEMGTHAEKHNLNFPVLKDEGNVIADKYHASVTPEVFLIDPQGILRYHGRIDDSRDPSGITSQDLKGALDAMLEGGEITTKEAKAFGCTIKRV